MAEKPIVFISCGQDTLQERQLGRDICSLIADLRPDANAYFAQNQSTVEGLNSNIFGYLHRSAALICVMHGRGEITLPEGRSLIRSSVWIEQEIAIAAFIYNVLKRPIPILFYKQANVATEGIRAAVLVNSLIDFTHDSQVLDDLRSRLPTIELQPFMPRDLTPVVMCNKLQPGPSGHNRYRATFDIENSGSERVTDFQLRVYFPQRFLNERDRHPLGEPKLSTEADRCFTAYSRQAAPNGLYPEDRLLNPMKVEFEVDPVIFLDGYALISEVIVEILADRMPKKQGSFKIRD